MINIYEKKRFHRMGSEKNTELASGGPYKRNRPPQLPVFLLNLSLLRKPRVSYFENCEMNGGTLICEGRQEQLSLIVQHWCETVLCEQLPLLAAPLPCPQSHRILLGHIASQPELQTKSSKKALRLL